MTNVLAGRWPGPVTSDLSSPHSRRVPVSPDPDLKSVNGINGRHADIQIGLHNPDEEQ